MLKVIGCVFQGKGQFGDFDWMINQHEYSDAFFVFNDNQELYESHRDNPNNSEGCSLGSGNASIRPYQCKIPPRAGGVPTGLLNGGGYPSLTQEVQGIIDQAVATIGKTCEEHSFHRLFYNTDAKGNLGTGIFSPGDDVKKYIVQQLKKLGE